MEPVVRPYDPPADERWAEGFLDEHLGGRRQARGGEIIDVLEPGLGLIAGDGLGLLTYRVEGEAIELTAIASSPRGRGIGTALVNALLAMARDLGCTGIRVTTTNDNLDAIAFYRRRGFHVEEVRAWTVDEARRTIKPSIPLVGQHGIDMHDEIELSRVI